MSKVLVVAEVLKHLAGKHNQKLHGRETVGAFATAVQPLRNSKDLTALLGTSAWKKRPEDLFQMAHANNVGAIDTTTLNGTEDAAFNASEHLGRVLNRYGFTAYTEYDKQGFRVGIGNFDQNGDDVAEVDWLMSHPTVPIRDAANKADVISAYAKVMRQAGLKFSVHAEEPNKAADVSNFLIGGVTFFKITNKPKFSDAEAYAKLKESNDRHAQSSATNLAKYKKDKFKKDLKNLLRLR